MLRPRNILGFIVNPLKTGLWTLTHAENTNFFFCISDVSVFLCPNFISDSVFFPLWSDYHHQKQDAGDQRPDKNNGGRGIVVLHRFFADFRD